MLQLPSDIQTQVHLFCCCDLRRGAADVFSRLPHSPALQASQLYPAWELTGSFYPFLSKSSVFLLLARLFSSAQAPGLMYFPLETCAFFFMSFKVLSALRLCICRTSSLLSPLLLSLS